MAGIPVPEHMRKQEAGDAGRLQCLTQMLKLISQYIYRQSKERNTLVTGRALFAMFSLSD